VGVAIGALLPQLPPPSAKEEQRRATRPAGARGCGHRGGGARRGRWRLGVCRRHGWPLRRRGPRELWARPQHSCPVSSRREKETRDKDRRLGVGAGEHGAPRFVPAGEGAAGCGLRGTSTRGLLSGLSPPTKPDGVQLSDIDATTSEFPITQLPPSCASQTRYLHKQHVHLLIWQNVVGSTE
jgi:hypothetical protein